RRLHLAPIGGVAAARRRIVGTAELDDLAGRVLHHVAAGDEIGEPQAYLAARCQPEELLRWVLHEIVALDIEFARERHLPRAGIWIGGMIDRIELFGLAFRI